MTATVFRSARLTLEAETALSIASGTANGVFDSSLVMDANDLPAIPGSALAGVLRSLYLKEFDETQADAVFGFQDMKKGDLDESKPSQVNVSWGVIQDSQGKAIQGLVLDTKKTIENDAILKAAATLATAPKTRDRVRLNHKGVSADMGKFDRAVLPAGYRFSVELSMWLGDEEPEVWKNVLALFKHPLFRLGGMTRAGLGKMKLVSLHQFVADLKTPEGKAAFLGLSSDLNDLSSFSEYQPEAMNHNASFVSATIRLKPNSYWRIGQGSEATKDNDGKFADLLPKLEEKIGWDKGFASIAAKNLLVPASSVKGALSHRIAFHANRLASEPVWAEEVLEKTDAYDKSESCGVVRALFGFANSNNDGESMGQAGAVFIDDGYRDFSAEKLQLLMHNSIDRFSGGVRNRMLFSEEMVWGEGVEINLTIDKKALFKIDDEPLEKTKEALNFALEDLCKGRLALGAGVSKGHGLFTGEVTWSDGGEWLAEGVK